MSITEQVQTIYKLNDELQVLLEEESTEYKKVIEQKDDLHVINRNGAAVEVTKGELLEEIRVAGMQQAKQAVEVLEQDFPRLFEVAKEREQKNTELHDYILEHFGFSFTEMRIADYMKLTEAMIEYKNEQKGS